MVEKPEQFEEEAKRSEVNDSNQIKQKNEAGATREIKDPTNSRTVEIVKNVNLSKTYTQYYSSVSFAINENSQHGQKSDNPEIYQQINIVSERDVDIDPMK